MVSLGIIVSYKISIFTSIFYKKEQQESSQMKFIIHKEPITSLVLERRICFPRLSEAQ